MTRDHRVRLLYAIFAGVGFLAAYHTTFSWMYHRYTGADSYYSHGFLIPLATAYLIWQRREQLRKIEITSSWWGLLLILIAVFIHICGVIFYVFFVSSASILFFIFGASLFLFGKHITKVMFFALAFLIFMLPIPQILIEYISFPMKMMVAVFGTWIANQIGIPVFREGVYITIPAGSLIVENPCSGLRSLISFLAIGSIYSYTAAIPRSRKIILSILAIPIALLSNIIRVPILIAISHYWDIAAAAPDSFIHTASGLLVFITGMVAFISMGKLLQCKKSIQEF